MGVTPHRPPAPRPRRSSVVRCEYCGLEYAEFRTKCDEGCGAPLRHEEPAASDDPRKNATPNITYRFRGGIVDFNSIREEFSREFKDVTGMDWMKL